MSAARAPAEISIVIPAVDSPALLTKTLAALERQPRPGALEILVVDRLAPDLVLVDQLSYAATVALHALGRPFASFHPGHPSGIPGAGELFGLPHTFPSPLPVHPDEVARLHATCVETAASFTAAWNGVVCSCTCWRSESSVF